MYNLYTLVPHGLPRPVQGGSSQSGATGKGSGPGLLGLYEQHKIKQSNARGDQDKTKERVEKNKEKIEEVRLATEELRQELREQAMRTDGLQERMESLMDEELREREARRLNLVIHGLPEPDGRIKDPRDRMERDKVECEMVFMAMKARTRQQAVRFCRRISERGDDPRPLVFGVYMEEEKRTSAGAIKRAKEFTI